MYHVTWLLYVAVRWCDHINCNVCSLYFTDKNRTSVDICTGSHGVMWPRHRDCLKRNTHERTNWIPPELIVRMITDVILENHDTTKSLLEATAERLYLLGHRADIVSSIVRCIKSISLSYVSVFIWKHTNTRRDTGHLIVCNASQISLDSSPPPGQNRHHFANDVLIAFFDKKNIQFRLKRQRSCSYEPNWQ